MTSYQWANYRSAMPGPQFSTRSARPEPGLNVMLRQPIPSISGMPWHVEASAEIRNLLAQGYLPLTMADGQQLLLVNTPRSFRGGLGLRILRTRSRVSVLLRSACPIVAFAAALSAQPVTFNRQIAPIIYNNCSSCHRPGKPRRSPCSRIRTSEERPHRRGRHSSRIMPPWKAEPASYPYRDERRLKDSEIALISNGCKAGMPEGARPKDRTPRSSPRAGSWASPI